MKQLVRQILDEYRSRWNTDSINVKEVITDSELDSMTDAIVDGIKSNDIPIKKTAEGWCEKLDVNVEEEEERKKWVCSLCGKSTFEVDWDYIGSGYNHLGCELEIEMAEDRRRKNSLLKKKVFGNNISSRTIDDAGVNTKSGKYVGGGNIPFGGDTGTDADFDPR